MKRFIRKTVSLFIISAFSANVLVFSQSSGGNIVRAFGNILNSVSNTFTEKEDDENSLSSEEKSKIQTITMTIGGSSSEKTDTKTVTLSPGKNGSGDQSGGSSNGKSSGKIITLGKNSSSTTGETVLKITSNASNASVYVDGSFRGTAPVTIKGISAGMHTVKVTASGYESYSAVRTVSSGKTTVCHAELARYKGILVINTNCSDVKYYCDGQELYTNVNKIPEGSHLIKVRKFGYKDFESHIFIRAFTVKRIYVTLVEAPFQITELTASRDVFNPDYSDWLGSCSITGSVTNKGSGEITVTDSSGQVVAAKSFPQFTTWNQTFSWNGKKSNGEKLPSGIYTVKFTAEKQSLSLNVRIDYSLRHFLFDFANGGLGIGTVPIAYPVRENTLYMGFSMNPVTDSSGELVDFPLGLQLSYTLIKGLSFDFKISGYFNRNPTLELSSEGIDLNVPTLVESSMKYTFSLIEADRFRWNLGFSAGYGYFEGKTFAPYGIADAKGVALSVMTGFDFSKVFLGFTSQYVLGTQTCNLLAGDNTVKNAVTISFMPSLSFSINGWAALHSASGIYNGNGQVDSTAVDFTPDFMRALEFGAEISWMLPHSSLYLTAGETVYYYPLQKVYYSTILSAKVLF